MEQVMEELPSAVSPAVPGLNCVPLSQTGPEGLPRVSIVIPAYNAASTLRDAVDSALAQNYANLEVIVVNDGSTDDTGAIVASYDDRIVVVTQPNGGLSRARNAGIVSSTGEAITLLDADDILAPTCVFSRLRILVEGPTLGLVAGYYREVDVDGHLLSRIPERRLSKTTPFRQAVRRNWGPPVGWTFWRSVFDEVGGFDPLLDCCEDWDFVIRVAVNHSIGYDPEPLALYRRSPHQMTRDFDRNLHGQSRIHAKCRAYAALSWQYAVDRLLGSFQHRRRVLYELLFSKPQVPWRRRFSCLSRHPSLLLVGAIAIGTWLAGKRPSHGSRGSCRGSRRD